MWQTLFKTALAILDEAGLSADEWSFGGGTALALRYKHRESKDIDIFITDAQWLPYLTPRLNPGLRGHKDYEEASNYVKVAFDEGAIDFIVSPHLTPNHSTPEDICGHRIQVETPVEIVTKKLFYRAHSIKVRDVVDTAAVFIHEGQNLLNQASLLGEKLDILKRRWDVIKPFYDREVAHLAILDTVLAAQAPVLFEELLDTLLFLIT